MVFYKRPTVQSYLDMLEVLPMQVAAVLEEWASEQE